METKHGLCQQLFHLPLETEAPTLTSNFDSYSAYYNLFYKSKNYDAEVATVLSVFKTYHAFGKELLELGSGTGGHATHFASHGFNVTGVELSEKMIQLCSPVPRATFLQGDIRSFSLSQRFDHAVSLFHVISYLTNTSDILCAFRNIRTHLIPGSLFLFDFWYTPGVLSIKPSQRVLQASSDCHSITRIATPVAHYDANIVDVNYRILVHDLASKELTELSETHSMRHFTIPEMAHYADISGFDLLQTFDLSTGVAPSLDSWAATMVLRSRP